MVRGRGEVDVEATVDIEPTHLVLEVLVHNGFRGSIRDVRISPDVRPTDFEPDASAKGIADLPARHSGHASFALRARTRVPSAADIGATVTYVDARGSRQEVTAPRVRLDLGLPSLTPQRIGSDAFADRASRAFSHRIEVTTNAPPADAIRLAAGALETLPMVRVEEAGAPPKSGFRASLFGVDARGIGYLVRLVAASRRRRTALRVHLFSESEPGLFALHHRTREILDTALRSAGVGNHHA